MGKIISLLTRKGSRKNNKAITCSKPSVLEQKVLVIDADPQQSRLVSV